MAKRRSVADTSAIRQSKHDQMLDEMHSALSSLGSKIRAPFPSQGEKLLPPGLQPAETPEGKAAKAHIENLHGAFKALRKGDKNGGA